MNEPLNMIRDLELSLLMDHDALQQGSAELNPSYL